MKEQNLTKIFSLVPGRFAEIFRYDRWQKLLILKIILHSNDSEEYLVFRNCKFIQFNTQPVFNLEQFTITNEAKEIIVSDKDDNFIVRCSSINLWNEEAYDLYFDELVESVGSECYDYTMKLLSLEDLENILDNAV
jgi:hypothetical protein